MMKWMKKLTWFSLVALLLTAVRMAGANRSADHWFAVQVQGRNERVILGKAYYDNYMDSLQWTGATSLGLSGLCILPTLVPGLHASWVAGLDAGIVGIGSTLLDGSHGIIIRTRQVRRLDPVRGVMVYDELVSVRDQ